MLLHDATGLEQADIGGYGRTVVAALGPILAALPARGLGRSLIG